MVLSIFISTNVLIGIYEYNIRNKSNWLRNLWRAIFDVIPNMKKKQLAKELARTKKQKQLHFTRKKNLSEDIDKFIRSSCERCKQLWRQQGNSERSEFCAVHELNSIRLPSPIAQNVEYPNIFCLFDLNLVFAFTVAGWTFHILSKFRKLGFRYHLVKRAKHVQQISHIQSWIFRLNHISHSFQELF